MLFARVVLGLPVEGPFDYSFSPEVFKKIDEGFRVWVEFGSRKRLGYVVKIAAKTHIKRVKPILEVIDDSAVINKNMLLLTRKLSDYYACSWGEAIEVCLPASLRGSKAFELDEAQTSAFSREKRKFHDNVLVFDKGQAGRWKVIVSEIRAALLKAGSVIFLVPEVSFIDRVLAHLKGNFFCPITVMDKQITAKEELKRWREIRAQKTAALRADIVAVNLRHQKIDIEQHVAEDAVRGQELAELLAQHEERGIIIVDVDGDVVDVAVPDFAQHAGVGPPVPDPTRHQRVLLRVGVMQQFGGEIAHPAKLFPLW